jgi:DNA repair exonuclease SbcCD ATPase subunit
MRPLSIELSNFARFDNLSIDLSKFENSPILILGENRDDCGMNSNGSGKTSLINSIVWNLLGKVPYSNDSEIIIRHGSNQCYCNITYETGLGILQIARMRGSNKKSLKILLNNKDIVDYSTATDTQIQNELLKLLGIKKLSKETFNDFLNTVYLSSKNTYNFVSGELTSSDRFKMISRMLNLNVYDKASEIAKNKITELEKELNDQLFILSINNNLELLHDELKSLKSITEIKNNQIVSNKTKISETENIITILQNDIEILKTIKEIKNDVEKLSANRITILDMLVNQMSTLENKCANLETLLEQRNKIDEEIKELFNKLGNREPDEIILENENLKEYEINKAGETRTKLTQLKLDLDFINNAIDNQLNCPYCNNPITIDSNKNLCKLNIVDARIRQDYTKLTISNLSLELSKNEKTINEISNKNTIIRKIKTELNSLINRNTKITNELDTIDKIEEEITTIQEKIKSTDIEYNTKIEQLNNNISELNNKISGIDSEIKHKEACDTINNLKYETVVLESELKTINSSIISIEERKKLIKDTNNKIKLIDKSLEPYKFWKDGFQSIKYNVIDKFLPEFTMGLNNFLNKMEVGINVKMDTRYETKTSRDIVDRFNIKVYDQDLNIRDITTFSDGEQRRISIANGFSMREQIKLKSNYMIDFLLIDEFADGLDSTGSMKLFEILNSLNIFTLIVSHDEEFKQYFSNIIKVVRENGVSKIKI